MFQRWMTILGAEKIWEGIGLRERRKMKASDRSCDERKVVCERISEMFQVMAENSYDCTERSKLKHLQSIEKAKTSLLPSNVTQH